MKSFFRQLLCGSLLFSTVTCLQSQSAEQQAFDDILFSEEQQEVQNLDELLNVEIDLKQLQAKNKTYTNSPQKTPGSYSNKKSSKEEKQRRNSWLPSFEESSSYQTQKSFFFKSDIGLGLLYFSGTKGNFGVQPTALVSTSGRAPYKGSLTYNRTPLYDFSFGYRFCPCLQLGFGYIHQGNVTVQTPKLAAAPGANENVANATFSSNLSLDALTLRVYTEGPWPVFWRNAVLNTYLGVGAGLGWQTWTANSLQNDYQVNNLYRSYVLPFKQKVSTNAVFGADLGLRVQSFGSSNHFSMSGGVKFNLWGQARNMGELTQQGSYKFGLFSPFRIKTIYQWAPYLSVQWSFPNGSMLKTKQHIKSQMSPMLVSMNAGVGALSFKHVRGNLISVPNQNGDNQQSWQTARVKGKLSYNVTPLYEYLIQQRFNDWVQLGFSYQNQGGVFVKTSAIPSGALGSVMVADSIQLGSYLNLNALLVKGYVMLPLLPFHRMFNVTPYFGIGVGPSWQTWSRVEVTRTGSSIAQSTFFSGVQPVRQKISANCMLNLDWGIKLTSIHEKDYFSVLAGCKYNYWGQARNIGKQDQQGRYSLGLNAPFRIQRVIQWAPYLGVQWDFPNNYYGSKPYYLDGRSPNTWKPYSVAISQLQKDKGLFTQVSTGIGFLYFRGVTGNLSTRPQNIYREVSRDTPLKGRLTYNRTPLFEYQVGYRFMPRFQASFSYQHQGNVTVQTQVLHNFNDSNLSYENERSQLTADLLLDALMLKFYTEYPKAVIWKNVGYTPFFALGSGVSWQTWKRVVLNQPFTTFSDFSSATTLLRQKVSMNAALMLDAGLRMQSPFPNTGLSVSAGIKFNVWGQARSLGDLQDQYAPTQGLSQPFKVLTVYQWAPYLGVQWNF